MLAKVRQVEETDKSLLFAAASADPYHAKIGLTGAYWAGKDSFIYEDDHGPVLAMKKTEVVRLDLQFLTPDQVRNASIIREGFDHLLAVLVHRGVKEIIFNTESPEVAHFFQHRFSFRLLTGDTFSLRIRA